MREDNRRKNSGFTLVEVLVAVAILAVVSVPIIQSFVSVAQINSKSRRRQIATTIAESVMESCKAMTMAEFAAQFDYYDSSKFSVIAKNLENNSGSVSNARELDASGTNTIASSNRTAKKNAAGVVSFYGGPTAAPKTKFVFLIEGVSMGGGKYDAVIEYKPSARDTSGKTLSVSGTTKTVAQVLAGEGLRVLKYYDVEIRVYRAGGRLTEDPLSTIQGTVTDYNE